MRIYRANQILGAALGVSDHMIESREQAVMSKDNDHPDHNSGKTSTAAASSNVTQITTHPLERKPDDWAPLMLRVADARDRVAYAKIFDHFAPKVKSFALLLRSSFTSQEMADELVQEVMLKVWLKAASFNPSKASVSTWIFTIARNSRIDYIRKMKRGDVQLDNEVLWEIVDEREPVASLEELRVQKHMRAHIDDLPAEQADALKQIYLQGKSHAEVAEQSKLPLGTVKSRVRLAMNKLRAKLTEENFDQRLSSET